jgi:rubrerythrin
METFAGESQARNKYTYFASKAKKEGYEQIAAFLRKLRKMRKSMQKSGLNSFLRRRDSLDK